MNHPKLLNAKISAESRREIESQKKEMLGRVKRKYVPKAETNAKRTMSDPAVFAHGFRAGLAVGGRGKFTEVHVLEFLQAAWEEDCLIIKGILSFQG